MKLVKLSEIPIFKIIQKCIENKWELNRYWKSPYVDLDTYYILDKSKNKLHDNLSYEELCKIILK